MLFSIITPCFNSESTISKTIESILNQTLSDYEYLIIDGGSTDRTLEIIKYYEPKFEGRLHWISERDSGIYNAMNKGIRAASGDIVGIVNSDDWLESNALDIVKENILSNNIDISTPFVVTGEMKFHYQDGKSVIMKTSFKRYEHYAKVYRMGLNHPATFVSKSAYERFDLFDENLKLYADADLIVRFYKNNVPVIFVNSVLSNMLDGGASNVYSRKIKQDDKYILKKHSKSKGEYYKLLFKRRMIATLKFAVSSIASPILHKYREYVNE